MHLTPIRGAPSATDLCRGSLDDVDFEGLEYGDYSKKRKGVVVKIAVPKKVLQENDLAKFVIDSLFGANAMAFEFFRQRDEEFPLCEAEAWVAGIANKLNV